ncbi:MAG: CDP-alcohol phosphatidyltransferase family protein [Planctomycetota bacterium]
MSSSWLAVWSRVQALAWVPALVWIAWSDRLAHPGFGFGLALALGASTLTLAMILRTPRTPADGVTLLRAVGLAAVVASHTYFSAHSWWLWSLLAAIAALDLVDGWLARRTRATESGALLDMETDQLAVLAMAILVVVRGGGSHVLLLPALRYLFVLSAWWLGMPANESKPVDGDNQRGRIVCAIVVCALLFALLPCDSGGALDLVTLGAVVLLAWSFAGDWFYLFARRRQELRL